MSSALPPRLLMCGGPAFEAAAIGGIQHVLADLVDGLRGRGWHVDTLFFGPEESGPPLPAFRPAGWQFRLGLVGAALRLPESVRLPVSVLLHGGTRVRALSAMLSRIDEAIRRGDYAAVIACLDVRAPIGLGAMAAASHPGAILISLEHLAWELRHAGALKAGRAAARVVGAGHSHPHLYSAVRPASAAALVFASGAWRDAAVTAGLPMATTRVIPFGVRVPETLPGRGAPAKPARLLWAARLSARKGLDLFLPAVALLRRERPVRLTLLAAPAGGPYPSQVARLVDRLGLSDIVEQRPAVERGDLPTVFASHDMLLFHSVFREPVAQMLLLAFAHGLPVVGPASPDPRSLLQDGETAFCFADRSAASVAAAIGRALDDEEARAAVRRSAFARVADGHSLGGTIAAYDVLLKEVVNRRQQAAPS